MDKEIEKQIEKLVESPDDYDEEEYDEVDDEEEFESLLYDAALDIDSVRNVRTYDETGVLTRNKGLVVLMHDGKEYQITIVRSK